MNKLFENWRGYLFEQEASWVEDLKKDTWVVLDKTKFKEIGSGAFRTAYKPVGVDGYVIKVIQNPRDTFMNYKDIELSNKYPDIVPKTYAHGPCFKKEGKEKCGHEWIVMEEVTPIDLDDKELFIEMMKVNFPDIINLLVTDDKGRQVLSRYMATRAHYVMAIWVLIMESINHGDVNFEKYTSQERAKIEDEPESTTPGVVDIPDMPLIDEPGSADVRMVNWSDIKEIYKRIFDIGMQNNVYRQLFKIVSVDEADMFDIGPGNIAVDDRSNFKILDTSIFD